MDYPEIRAIACGISIMAELLGIAFVAMACVQRFRWHWRVICAGMSGILIFASSWILYGAWQSGHLNTDAHYFFEMLFSPFTR